MQGSSLHPSRLCRPERPPQLVDGSMRILLGTGEHGLGAWEMWVHMGRKQGHAQGLGNKVLTMGILDKHDWCSACAASCR